METPKNAPIESSSEVGDQVQAEARRWLAAIYAEGGSVDPAQFRAWLAVAPEHAHAYHALEQAWRDLPLSSALDVAIRRVPSHRQVLAVPMPWARRALAGARGWQIAGVLAASLLVCVAVGLAWETGGVGKNASIATAAYTTGVAQVVTVSLPDGSTVALGANSGITTQFTKSARAIRLGRGTAYFDIAHDPSRPATVQAGNASLHVLGTAFEVWRGPSGVRLSVVRGRVAVEVDGAQARGTRANSRKAVSVGAGDQVTIGIDGRLSDLREFAPGDLLSWRNGRLSYRDAALADIVADLNRYRTQPIRILDKRAGSLRVTAAFNANQGEQILAGLAASQPIVVRKAGNGLVISSSD